jgi:hypothetical protein
MISEGHYIMLVSHFDTVTTVSFVLYCCDMIAACYYTLTALHFDAVAELSCVSCYDDMI